MPDLIVISPSGSATAHDVRAALMRIDRAYLGDVSTAITASVDDIGEIGLEQDLNLWSAGSSGQDFRQLVGALLFAYPLRGVMPEAIAGELAAALLRAGLDRDFMSGLFGLLVPDHASLLLLAQAPASSAIRDAVGAPAALLAARLNEAALPRLRAALTAVRREAERQQALLRPPPAPPATLWRVVRHRLGLD